MRLKGREAGWRPAQRRPPPHRLPPRREPLRPRSRVAPPASPPPPSHLSPNVFQPLELLCEKSIGTANRPMGAGEALRRVLECLASGIVMPG